MKKRKFKLTIRMRDAFTGYMFILPWLIGFFGLALYPVIYSFIISVNYVTFAPGQVTMDYVGFINYFQAINHDLNFVPFLINDLRFISVSIFIVLIFSLIIAVMLNGKYRFRALLRLIFFLPVVIISGPIVRDLLGTIDNFNFDIDVVIIAIFNIIPYQFISPVIFVLTNLVPMMWFSGVQILIFLAGLQKIDRSVYEAAEIDGAGKWECFWKITLPHMKLLILINIIYTIVEIANFAGTDNVMAYFQSVDEPTGFVQANQVNSYILRNVVQVTSPFSFSAAMSWIYTAAILALILIVFGGYKIFDRGANK